MDHPVVMTLLIFAIIAFMYAAGEVLKPLALAILLSFALVPVSRFFENRGLPRAPSVVLTVLVAVGLIGFMTYKVGQELDTMADNVDTYEDNITSKLKKLQPGQANALSKVTKVGADIGKTLTPTDEKLKGIQTVRLYQETDFLKSTETMLGPYVEGMGTAAIVFILLLFLMINRENMGDRLTQLFGEGKISLTTRTIEEVGHRISKYLITFAAMNTAMGITIGLGCYFIGIEYAVLWGFLAGALRFIPYAGPATAFGIPLLFTFARYEGWYEPLALIGLYAAVETLANVALEPIIYGKTTGVSALALLVSAMFWTWLWGPLGLLLSTPLTVCLAVLGKYVPSLHFFATFLHEEVEFAPGVRYYQRLLSMDQDGASEVVDEKLEEHTRAEVFDMVVVPTLSMAERDHSKGEIDDREFEFVHFVTTEIVDDLEDEPEVEPSKAKAISQDKEAEKPKSKDRKNGKAAGLSSPAATPPPRALRIMAVPAKDATDALVLRILALLLKPSGLTLNIDTKHRSPLSIVEQIGTEAPDMVLISHLPPDGLTAARYLIRRIRSKYPKLPIVVGRWDFDNEKEGASRSLIASGASHVFNSLAEARDHFQANAHSLVAASREPVKV